MANKKTASKQQKHEADVVKKVEHLVSLADDNDNEDEARNAALAAVRLMKEHELTVVPRIELERAEQIVGEAKELVARAKAEGNKNLLIAGLAGYLFGGGAKKLF